MKNDPNIEYYRDSHIFELPATATAGSQVNRSANLDTSYDRCVGAITQVIADGGDANFRIGINNSGIQVESMNHNANWTAGQDTAIDERVKPFDFNIASGDTKVNFEPQTDLGSVLKVEITFILMRRKKED